MIEASLGAFAVALGVVLWFCVSIKMRLEAQTAAIVSAVGALENLQELAQDLADAPDMTTQVVETLEDTFSNMHVPTGQDHIQAAIATGMNMLFAKMWGGQNLAGLMGGLLEQNLPDSGENPTSNIEP